MFNMTLHRDVRGWPSVGLTIALLGMGASGCAAVEGIFKAGVWVGIIAVAVVAGLIAVMTGMFRQR
jgi:hypothetical protein